MAYRAHRAAHWQFIISDRIEEYSVILESNLCSDVMYMVFARTHDEDGNSIVQGYVNLDKRLRTSQLLKRMGIPQTIDNKAVFQPCPSPTPLIIKLKYLNYKEYGDDIPGNIIRFKRQVKALRELYPQIFKNHPVKKTPSNALQRISTVDVVRELVSRSYSKSFPFEQPMV